MDNIETTMESPALPTDIDIEHTQQICNYLQSLRDRLKQTLQQHSEMIQTSVNLVREMSDLATTLALTQSTLEQQPTKIKRLIMEFESLHAGDNGLGSVDAMEFHGLLTDFRRLHESQLLRDSLMCFKRAKDSLEEIDLLLSQRLFTEKLCESAQASPNNSRATMSASRCLRDRILAFNQASSVQGQNMLQNFTTCFSNSCPNIATADEMKPPALGSRSHTNSGYEGDVDSEIEQVASSNRNRA
ncbi:uncharacterized protein LOC6568416 [Drosophila grimshawi]|uniref:GH13761 n=1 Tax=Drosophila grimshawi TaxID=7222 RepID=B4JTR7_DROGR|nr:uncharacterized protein LOC6568416 [Drosophila grimshawi]EDV91496.1 GH13761 [Drosophila grimshawi]